MSDVPRRFLDLSKDELLVVYDFSPSSALSMTSKRLWELMKHRYKPLRLQQNVQRQMEALLDPRVDWKDTIHILQVSSHPTTNIALEELRRLQELSSLEVLILNLTRLGLSLNDLNFLCALGDLRLTSLAVWLSSNKLPTTAITKCLPPVLGIKTLQSLSLHLMDNKLGDGGAKSLANAICCLPALQVVRLDLESNGVTQIGVEPLAQLKDAPQLHTLELTLSHNRIGDDGAGNLGGLLVAPTINRLTLRLDGCSIGDNGVTQLIANAGQKHFISLRLSLQYGSIDQIGAEELVKLSDVESLELRLTGNQIPYEAALIVKELADKPAEKNLTKVVLIGLASQIVPVQPTRNNIEKSKISDLIVHQPPDSHARKGIRAR
eukprot:GGOE01012571.1.p1 GENE.GGOE01012571.1~~GGOE01012571.1.p1  ORF type:complete len:406 (+),score=40.85 GGOE01012571.1:86-1219(+)